VKDEVWFVETIDGVSLRVKRLTFPASKKSAEDFRMVKIFVDQVDTSKAVFPFQSKFSSLSPGDVVTVPMVALTREE